MQKYIIISLLTLLVFNNVTSVTAVTSTASESSELDLIKDNVKKRPLNQIQNNPSAQTGQIAFAGLLSSIANETLTLETDSGVKLASTSATTSFQNADTQKPAKSDDLTIDNYIVAIGSLNTSQVLDASTIILHEKKPETLTTKTEFGLVTSYDPRTKAITINNPFTQKPLTANFARKAKYFELNPSSKNQASDAKAIIVNQSLVLVVYENSEESQANTIQSILIKNSQNIKSDRPIEDDDTTLPPEIQAQP